MNKGLEGFISKIREGVLGKPQAATVPIGGYEGAARYSTDRSYIYYSPNEDGANPDSFTRHEILNLARYMVNNYSLMERILTVAENYSVGAGILAQGATKDRTYNDEVSLSFDKWGNSTFCSVNHDLNLYDIQKLIVRELLLAGEVFLVLSKAESGYPQLMLIPSENVRTTGKKSDKSIDGLFVDSSGKVTAYQIYLGGKKYQIIEASNVIHLKRTKNINQLRGVSCFAASLNSLRDHKDLMALEKKCHKLHAALSVVVKRRGEAGEGIFGNVTKKETVKDGRTAVYNRGLEKAFAGNIAYLSEGEDVELMASQRSTGGFISFLELLARDVCLNLSIPYEFLVDPSKVTGTGIRFVIQDADCLFRNLQNVLIDGALNRVYTWVSASFIKDGKLKAPKGDKDYFNVSWVRPASITIDQGRVSNAEISLMQNSMLTFDMYYSARGLNWKDALRQKAIEEQYLNELSEETGVPIERLRTLAAGSPAPTVPTDKEKELEEAA